MVRWQENLVGGGRGVGAGRFGDVTSRPVEQLGRRRRTIGFSKGHSGFWAQLCGG